MTAIPPLSQFRLEVDADRVAQLVFDCPGRTMNVFSEAAIAEIGAVARWLAEADVRGLLIVSGKDNAFCAGADLTELGLAYDMIVAAPPRARFALAFDHFFRLSAALRALETAGRPVVAAVGGLALGGGCELALAAHRRVLADDLRAAFGLPESLVGLLPGAGGTQRLPRIIGLEAALPVLLDGARLGGKAASAAGLADELVAPGAEVEAARAWLLSDPEAVQPWDRPDWRPAEAAGVATVVADRRRAVLADTLGHYPAPLAILDCVGLGLPQPFEGAIRTEMAIFAELIQREEPRNMIASLFLAKTEYERLARRGNLPPFLDPIIAAVRGALDREDAAVLAKAGFPGAGAAPVRDRAGPGYWLDGADGADAGRALARVGEAVAPALAALGPDERRLADYAVVRETGYPAYLGGPSAYSARN